MRVSGRDQIEYADITTKLVMLRKTLNGVAKATPFSVFLNIPSRLASCLMTNKYDGTLFFHCKRFLHVTQ